MTWLHEHATGLAWTFAAWAFLIAVTGGALLRRWYAHEHEEATETEAVMQSLKPDLSRTHELDAL